MFVGLMNEACNFTVTEFEAQRSCYLSKITAELVMKLYFNLQAGPRT